MRINYLFLALIIVIVGYLALPFYYLIIDFKDGKDLLSFLWVFLIAIIAIFQEQFRKELFAPILRLEFNAEPPSCIKVPLTFENKIVSYAYKFRFRVKNTGQSQAKLCECVAEELWSYENSNWVQDKNFQSINLMWSDGKSTDEFLNINPNCPGWHCDLIHQYKNEKELVIDFKPPIPNSQTSRLKAGIRHKIKVSVYSENAKPVSRTFEVLWSGKWEDEPENMFKAVLVGTV